MSVSLSFAMFPFSPFLFLGTASGSFLRPAASRLLLSRFLPENMGSLPECSRSLWKQKPSLLGASGKRGKKRRNKMSYLNSVTLVGFVGSDPEQRQAKGNGSKFTVLSVATQRSWKNTEDEWSSKTEWHRVVVFRPLLAERVAATIKKGAHVLVEGSLVSSVYLPANGKSKKNQPTKITSWTIRADAVRRLDRGEAEPQAPASEISEHSSEASQSETF
jgi:single stranded DNA-binding protein